MKRWLLPIILATCVMGSVGMPMATQAQSVTGMAVVDEAEDYITEISYTLEQPFGGKAAVFTLAEYIQTVYQFALGIIGIMAVVLIMFGGLRWVAAAGNESVIGEAKEIISSAVIGLVIALLSYVILLFINPTIVTSGLKVPKIPIPTSESSFSQCTTDLLVDPTGAKFCHTSGTQVTGTELNGFIDKYKGSVSATYIKAIMKTESNYCIDAMSNIKDKKTGLISHACGLMQVMPTTATNYSGTCGVPECAGITSDFETDPKAVACCNALMASAEKAVCVGASHLNTLKTNTYTKGDFALMAAAYNGGTCNSSGTNGALCASKSCPGQLSYQCDKNSGYAETRKYVEKVQTNYDSICTANLTSCTKIPGTNNTANAYYCKRSDASGFGYASCGTGIGARGYGSYLSCGTYTQGTWILVSAGCNASQRVDFGTANTSKLVGKTIFDAAPTCATSCTRTDYCSL